MTTTGYYVDGKGYIQIEDWEKDRFLSQYPGARQREKGKQVHYEVPNKGRIEISPEEETTFLSQYPNAVPSKYLEQRQSLLAETKKLTTDPLKLAELALPISDETLLTKYNAAITGQKEASKLDAPSGYESGYAIGKVGKKQASQMLPSSIMPSGRTLKEEQDAEEAYGSIRQGKKRSVFKDSGKYIADIVKGFGLATGTMTMLPLSGAYNLFGEQEKAQQIQGYIDAKYEKYGFSKPIEGNLLEQGRAGELIAAGFRSFIQSAPITAMWVANPVLGTTLSFATAAPQKYNELDREHPELETRTKAISALVSGGLEAATEHLGNVIGIGKTLKLGSKLPEEAFRALLTKRLTEITTKTMLKHWAIESLSEGGEEFVGYIGEYATDCALGIIEYDPKAFMDGLINATVLGTVSGSMQGSIGMTRNMVLNSRYTNIEAKLQKSANKDLSNISDPAKYNAANNLKTLAQKTIAAVEMAQAGDTQGAIELAQENNNYILRTRMAKAGSASLDTIGMYNALILDTITSVETIQAAENAVPEEKAPRKPKPKSELPVVDTPKVETAPLYEMAQEALKSKDLEQITAAKTAFAEALSETANPNEIQQLRSMIAKLNKAEKGILDAEAETKKKSEPVVKESLTTETEESRYTKMAWPDLRAEAKERGINTFGANKAYIIEKLTAMDVEEAAKPKPVELSNEDMNAASVDIKGIVTPAMEANTEADFDTAISKLNKMLDGAHDIVRSMIGTELDKLRKAKLKLGPKDIKLNVADQSAAMDVGEVNETIDHRDPAESKVIPKEQVGNEAIVTKEGEDIPVKYALVDIDDVIVSQNLDSFEDNPEYPKPLQNRERKDQEATVIGYAQNLKPALLGDAAVASDGRPIAYIDTNGRVVIIAGNGRTMAIQMRHKGRYGSLSQYAQYIKENLSKFGISDQDTKGKMLVAIYSGDTDLVSLARLLNKSEQKELSPVEKAQSDAVAIANARKNGNDILLKLDGSTKGLMTEANKPFIDAFVDLNISSTERDIYYKNDIYTTLLSERIENALFMYIFNNDAKAERLLSNLRELDSSSVKSILKAIMDNVKPIARLRNLIEVYDTLDYDITQDLLDGVAEIDRLRKEGIPIGEAISEQDIFSESNQLIPDAKIMFYTALAALKSQVKADNFIAGYYSAAITALDPEQSSIFDSNLSKEDFLNEYCEEWLGEDAPERSKKTDDTQSDRSSPEPEAGKDAADVKAKLAKTAEVVPTPVVAENAITPEELAAKEKQLTKDKKALEAADKKLAALEARIDKADDAGRDTGDMEDKLADLEDVIADLEDKINVAEEEIKEFTKNLPKPVKADIAPTEKLTPTQNFHDQYTEAQQGKLTAEQITAQLEVIDTMFGTFAKTMGLTLDQVYDSWIEAVTNEQLDPNSIENALNQEISISSGPAIKSTVIPKKTVRAYRMGWLNPDGTVSSVKVDESQKTRQNFEMGVWYDAEMRKSNMALIPGFHFAYLPSLPQLYRQDGTPFENRVYYIAEYDATISYQEQADATKEKFLRGIIPENGFYFRRSGKIKQWAISGKMMPVRVLSMAEVDAINKAAGVETINGMPVAEFEKRQKKAKRLNQDLAAYVTFDKDGKATIGFLKPDISSGLHEASHIFRRMMAQMADKDIRWSKLYNTAMTFSEVENGNWTVENEEKFAKGFEKFLATGQASNPKIATVFSKIKAWMQELVSRLKDLKGIKLDANISAVYDAMLGGKPKEHLTQAQKAAATKVKKAMVASSTANPIQLQKSLDQLVDQLGTVVLRSKKTGSTTNMVISGIDNNVNLVEIVHTSEGYIVNGNAYDNNADAMDAVTNLLNRNSASQTLGQATPSEIAEAERQMAEVRSKYEGTTEWMKAPNGKPTNLNERQWLQVRTQLFKDWFGDWINDPKNASKVVDENGEPRVVYHGKRYGRDHKDITNPFNEFSTEGWETETIAGAYFTENPKYAEVYMQGKGIIYPVFLSIKNPASHSDYMKSFDVYREQGKPPIINGIAATSVLKDMGFDGAIDNTLSSYSGVNEIIAFYPSQIKSATANTGVFGSENTNILYQLVKDDAGFVAKKTAAVEAAYRRAWIRLRSSKNVHVWRNAMSTAIDRFIRINYNGAKPFDQAKAAEILSSEMDEKEMAKKIRRMEALDKKYYDAIEQETGYRSLDEIPTIQLATVMYDIAPNSYDSFMSDGTLDSIRELIPTLASMGNMYGDVYTDVFLQTLVDASVFGRAKHQVISGFVGSILQSNKVLLKLFGKAGGKLITKALIAKTLHSEINNASQVYLNEIYDILYTTKNSMGHRYGVEDVSRIGEAIFNVENNKKIPTEDKLSAIQEMLSENETISPEDVATIYEAGRELMDFFAELNDNFNRKYKRKIGKQENYFPRIRIGDEIYGSTAPDGKYLYTPGFTKHRNKDEIDTRQINTDFHKVLREYSYRMSRYLSFYELADYVQPNDLIVNGQRIPQKSGFYRDTTLALSGNISSYEKYVVDYVHEVIGYHQSKGTAVRALSKMKVAAYTSLLAANAKLTMQNFGQKTLIFAAVGSHAAIPAAKDLKFLSGKAKITTPLIDKLLSGYLSHNQSLLLDTVAEMKRGTNSDRLDYYKSADYAETFADDTPNKKGKIKRAQHRAFAHQKVSQSYSLYSEVLTRSPFQYAEKGNRAYAHLAGVYEIVMATPAYQEAIKQGKTRHEAAEIALADPNIYRAAQTHGAAINAAVNADADSVFSPSVYRGPLKEFMTFLRYGHTFSLLMFNTFLPKSMKNAWSSDLYRLSMSGQTGVVKKAEIIRAMQSMIDLTSRSRIDAMVKSGQVTIRATEGKLTAKQVDSINRMLTKQMDAYVTGAKQFKKLVYGKNPKGILALGSFIIADAIFSFIYSYLRDLWISSINPDANLRSRSLEDHIFDSIQVIRFMNGFDIGSGLFINERGFGHSWRNLTKATLEWASRITPAGLTNNVSREYYGKYLTDEAVDLMLDE